MPVKLAILFYSTYGTNHRMAQIAEEAARDTGAEVRLRKFAETAPDAVVNGQDAWKAQVERMADIPEASPQDMEWADAYLFSAPTRFGQAPSQVRAFIDTLGPLWAQGKLADKAVSAMTSAQNPHGGQEATILGLYTTFLHWGSVIVGPGYTDPVLYKAGGNPYGYSHTQGAEFDDTARGAIAHQVRRLVAMTERLGG
ncbi:NAD(P)H:quinone oxidoreductase type IV [Cereibacter sediminicola]|uniref:NAD(P)H:quinone oxidoreductase type IV n=1 Tax=Cereibacter sediminicola TaxID=2584941 RepID=UPI0011A7F9AB|nr:NAD(P)H:quinone oxidoreductase type IV [Cereibacter sediminicola]